jgi:uncharacterized membrane protein (UPF0127 family)
MKRSVKSSRYPKLHRLFRSVEFQTALGITGILLGLFLTAKFLLFAADQRVSSAETICVKTTNDTTAHGRYNTTFGSRTCILQLERADTPEAREKGLSGRNNMSGAQGMLFTYENTGTQCMWMKDMHFAIDILWLDAKGTILSVKKNVTPETYPEIFCGENARMVVEVKAGVSNVDWLQVGQRI